MSLEPVKRGEITAGQPSSNVTVKGRFWLLLCLICPELFHLSEQLVYSYSAQFFKNNGAFILTSLNKQNKDAHVTENGLGFVFF